MTTHLKPGFVSGNNKVILQLNLLQLDMVSQGDCILG